MKTTTLERILLPERERRRANVSGMAGFAIPALGERPADPDWEPLLVTNMRGSLTSTKINSSGQVRYGFSETPPEGEPQILLDLTRILASREQSHVGLLQAMRWMEGQGVKPHHLVLPYDTVSIACDQELGREDIDSIMSAQGYVAQIVGGLLVLADDLPSGLLVGPPALAGFYTRSDDRLGITLTRLSTAWCTVTMCGG